MASKLLGYEGHEKLLDILSIMQVGVPDALNFATDLTAFFEENCKAEVMAEKSKAQNIQGLLIIAQKYLIKSQLFGKDEAFNVPKVGNYSNATAPKTSASASAAHNGSHPQVTKTVNGHHRIATSSFDNYAEESSVDVLKIEAMEKNLSLLNQEVKKIKDLEEGDRQIRTDIGHMKRDYEAKQTHLKQALKPLQDKLAELTHDLDSLKTEVKTMQGLKLAPGVAPFKGNGASGKPACVYVRVAYGHNRNEVHEFPTDENGNLSFTAVNAVYPGVNALKFESKETNSIRLCRRIGDIFEPPEDGWGNRLYIIHSPLSQATATAPPPVSNLVTSPFAGHPLFPSYLPTNPTLPSNLFNTGSMFK